MLKFYCTLALFSLVLTRISVGALHSNRIVGGSTAYEGQFPFQVSLRRQGIHACGGAIISRNYVLTAGHCVGYWRAAEFDCYPVSDYTIRAGSANRLMGGILVSVAEILVHENYGNYLNDIALLKLSESLIYSRNIQPVELPSRQPPINSAVTITGWGLTKEAGDMPQTLQWNTLTALTHSDCREINADSKAILCLGHGRGNGACNYDSGSAAIWNDELVGVANFIYYACGSTFPDAYANVYYHVEWIRKHTDL